MKPTIAKQAVRIGVNPEDAKTFQRQAAEYLWQLLEQIECGKVLVEAVQFHYDTPYDFFSGESRGNPVPSTHRSIKLFLTDPPK